jgi:hypothetical protein
VEAWRVGRWMVRGHGAEWLAAALPRGFALGLLLVELDAMVGGRWDVVAAGFAARPAWQAAAGFALAAAHTRVAEARTLRALWGSPRHRVLRRQPVPPAAYGPGLAALAAPVVATAAAAGAVWHGSPAGAALWGGAAVAAAASWAAVPAGAAVVAAAHAWPAATWPLAAASLAAGAAWAGVGWRATDLPAEGAPRSVRVPLPHPVAALVRRDLTLVARTQPALAGAPLAAGLAAAFVMRSVTANLGTTARGLSWAAATCVVVAGGLALAVPAAAARAAGTAFDPPRWPLRVGHRAAALGVVAVGALLPTWAAAAAAAPLDGVGHARLGGVVASVAAGAAWWVAARPERPAAGSFPWWCALCLLPATVDGGLASLAVAAGASLLATRALATRRGAR